MISFNGRMLTCVFMASFVLGSAAFGGQASVKDDVSQKNIVQVAVGSKDHTTLVTALKAADLVDSMANPGPFTVFAPTDAAFAKLPKGTVEGLLKPDKKAALQDILEYHVSVGVFAPKDLKDGMTINQVNVEDVKIKVKNGKTYVNDAMIVSSVRTSNGIIHIVDGVLLPPAKK